ncbi:unnamed protein product (macronuclear) [Paramecium tetraurelia]|uniref:Uncharacterized protein n=1 Tax=Paramecium tetraurelia TaxID=5888 RepID=A0CFJ3_PARTE|nr:uncharacterized protein GSPATT00037999001 [Paramecium tetraurelia]CAK69560.1 unnamed protein product [Paramecium tetraurelia]|eukprot:XP_001436957.1 hypothetical protein (macronuclear) [Paramecium tetraurelia strain d4-2]
MLSAQAFAYPEHFLRKNNVYNSRNKEAITKSSANVLKGQGLNYDIPKNSKQKKLEHINRKTIKVIQFRECITKRNIEQILGQYQFRRISMVEHQRQLEIYYIR